MTSKKTEHIETLLGTGFLSVRPKPVKYNIHVFQEFVSGVPCLRTARGQFADLAPGDAIFLMMAGKPVELTLEDGRHASILITEVNGAFEVSGGFSAPDSATPMLVTSAKDLEQPG
jgi:hypothetical protein